MTPENESQIIWIYRLYLIVDDDFATVGQLQKMNNLF